MVNAQKSHQKFWRINKFFEVIKSILKQISEFGQKFTTPFPEGLYPLVALCTQRYQSDIKDVSLIYMYNNAAASYNGFICRDHMESWTESDDTGQALRLRAYLAQYGDSVIQLWDFL